MPTYEYACPSCGIVEAFQSIKDDALKKCPQCKKEKVTRLVSLGGGVIFKGNGFWETDYNRSSDYTSRAKSESADSTPQTATAAVPAKTAAPSGAASAPGTTSAARPATTATSTSPAP